MNEHTIEQKLLIILDQKKKINKMLINKGVNITNLPFTEIANKINQIGSEISFSTLSKQYIQRKQDQRNFIIGD